MMAKSSLDKLKAKLQGLLGKKKADGETSSGVDQFDESTSTSINDFSELPPEDIPDQEVGEQTQSKITQVMDKLKGQSPKEFFANMKEKAKGLLAQAKQLKKEKGAKGAVVEVGNKFKSKAHER
jgi:hypothetical protein